MKNFPKNCKKCKKCKKLKLKIILRKKELKSKYLELDKSKTKYFKQIFTFLKSFATISCPNLFLFNFNLCHTL